jgi:N-acetylglucosamine kinase-like BadF-type ATPase
MTYRLGVDGGGTKTEAILVDASGAVVARQSGPGCNPSIVGPEAARTIAEATLRALVAPLRRADPGFEAEATLLCMAGSRAFWQEFAGSLVKFGRVVAVDDSLPVLELATGGEPGLVLHSGTGSFVAARGPSVAGQAVGPFGSGHYAGGLGWRLGDPGSAYDLGRRAIAYALLELQGWMPPSGLAELVRAQTGLRGHQEIARHFYAEPANVGAVAALAPGVLRLAGEGDPAALDVAVESAAELLKLALRVAAKLFPETPPGSIRARLSGRILTHPAVAKALADRSELRLRPIAEQPIEGVRRLLAIV